MTKKASTKKTKKSVKKSTPKSTAAKHSTPKKSATKKVPSKASTNASSIMDWSPEKGIAAVLVLTVVIIIALFVYFTQSEAVNTPDDVVDSTAIAVVNGIEVTQADYDGIALAARQIDPTISDDAILNQTIMISLLRQEAYKLGISADQLQVELIIAQRQATLEQQFGTEEFQQFLNESGLTKETYQSIERRAIEDDLLIGALLEQVVFAQVQNVTPAETLQYYEENIELFSVPEQRQISHILICYDGTIGCQSGLTQDQARQKIDDIKVQLTQRPQDFERLAREESTGPSAQANGSIGIAQFEDLVPAFSQVAFTSKASEITDVVETDFGYHIIRVDDIIAPRTLLHDEVQAELSRNMKLRNTQVAQTEYLKGLFDDATIIHVE